MKKGDIVTLIHEDQWSKRDNLEIGMDYTIDRIDSEGTSFKLIGCTYWHLKSNFKIKNMKAETTKERILEAASKCSTAKETLKTLFPEVFEDDKYFDLMNHKYSSGDIVYKNNLVEMRIGAGDNTLGLKSGSYFFLENTSNWEIIKRNGFYHLVPTKK